MMIPDWIITGIVFFLVLSVLVLIHELGHYVVARLIGVRVEEFGFGLPPKIFGKKFSFAENEWSLNYLPIGGFVRLAGEDELGESVESAKKKLKNKEIKRFFWARTKWERSAILLAGVTMNFLLAVGITSYLITQGLEEPAPRVKIEEVLPNSPANIAGITIGDSVRAIQFTDKNGAKKIVETRIPDELVTTIKDHLGEEVQFILLRDGKEIQISVTPRQVYSPEEGATGIKIGFDIQTIKYPWYQAPFYAFGLTIQRGKDMFIGLVSLPAKAFQGHKIQNEVAGPIGIAQVTGQAARIGPKAVLNLMSILSLSLALLNIMPIPALDGGRLLFILLESILGKPINASWERNAHQIGMILLLGLIALITLNDITRIFRG